jgi:quinol monooxygenase YgiN
LETVIARLKIKDGQEDAALKKLETMAGAVEQNEPKAMAYAVHRLRDDPSQIVFFEMYEDGDSLRSHNTTDHMKAFQENFGDVFDLTEVKIERLERVGGFVR